MIGEAMVMLTLARFVLEKTGGDSMAEVLDNLRRVPRADRGRARAAGCRRAARAPSRGRPDAHAVDPDAGEAGSGGDD